MSTPVTGSQIKRVSYPKLLIICLFAEGFAIPAMAATDICKVYSGPVPADYYGQCNAICNAKKCGTINQNGSNNACNVLQANFVKKMGVVAPCEQTAKVEVRASLLGNGVSSSGSDAYSVQFGAQPTINAIVINESLQALKVNSVVMNQTCATGADASCPASLPMTCPLSTLASGAQMTCTASMPAVMWTGISNMEAVVQAVNPYTGQAPSVVNPAEGVFSYNVSVAATTSPDPNATLPPETVTLNPDEPLLLKYSFLVTNTSAQTMTYEIYATSSNESIDVPVSVQMTTNWQQILFLHSIKDRIMDILDGVMPKANAMRVSSSAVLRPSATGVVEAIYTSPPTANHGVVTNTIAVVPNKAGDTPLTITQQEQLTTTQTYTTTIQAPPPPVAAPLTVTWAITPGTLPPNTGTANILLDAKPTIATSSVSPMNCSFVVTGQYCSNQLSPTNVALQSGSPYVSPTALNCEVSSAIAIDENGNNLYGTTTLSVQANCGSAYLPFTQNFILDANKQITPAP